MSKLSIRVISIALSVCMAILVCGCDSKGKKANAGNGITGDRVTVIDESTEQLQFFKDGVFNFNIIFPDEYTDEQYQIVKETVFAKARSVNNKRPNCFRESIAKENGLKNIYIGNTKSTLSKEAIDYINKDGGYFEEYVIIVRNGEIAINALNDTALKNALDYFDKNILKDKNSTVGNKYLYHFAGSKNDNIMINNVPISDYIINCTSYPQGMVMRGCEELQKAIKSVSGYEVQILTGLDDKYKYRIEVIEEGDDLNAYSVMVNDDGNMIISGGHGYSLNAALHKLAKNINAADKSKKLNIKPGKILSGNYDGNTINTDGYKLVFSDEFNGNALDAGWKIDEWESPESLYYVGKDAVSVSDGSLLIKSFPSSKKLATGDTGYEGGWIQRTDMEFSYGYFEIRAKMPKGTGHQTTFWMKGSRDSYTQPYTCEIDVFETFGRDDLLISGIHSWWQPDATVKGLKTTEAQQSEGHIQHLREHGSEMDGGRRYEIPLKNGEKYVGDDWHTYGCEWTPAYIKYYCDGYNYCTINTDTALIDPVTGEKVSEYMLFTSGVNVQFYLSSAISINKLITQDPDDFHVPTSYYVDYIHLYQVPSTGIYNKIK